MTRRDDLLEDLDAEGYSEVGRVAAVTDLRQTHLSARWWQ